MANCTIIKLKTVDQRLTVVQQPILASGDIGTVRVEYELDSYWEDYASSGTFYTGKQPEDVYEQPLQNGACLVPWEVLRDEGILYIGLRGVDAAGQVKTAAPIRYRIERGSPSGTGTSAEPTPDVYRVILTLVAQAGDSANEAAESSAAAAESSAAAAESSAAAAESSAAAMASSEEAKALAQSVRDDADNGVFNGAKGDRGERGAKGDTGRGYDGKKKLTLIASGTTTRKTPVSVEIPNALECDEIYISVHGYRRSSTVICYGAWNGKTVYKGNFWSDDNGNGSYDSGEDDYYYGPDVSDIVTLLTSTNEDNTYTEIWMRLCVDGVVFSSNGNNFYAKRVTGVGAAEQHYITIVPVEQWYDGYADDDVTYSVYVVDRDSSGEGDTAPEELVHAGIEDYLAENGLTAQAVVDADVLHAALSEVLK